MIERIPEFISNHPFLFAALAATIAMIAALEYQRLRRVAKPLTPSRATRLANSEDAVFIDTRKRADFEAGHLPNARNVPSGEVESQLKQLEKLRDVPVILYDEGGMEAERAAKTLAKNGFTNLYAIDGGMPAWRKAELPVRGPAAKGKDKDGDKAKAKAKGKSKKKSKSGAKGSAGGGSNGEQGAAAGGSDAGQGASNKTQ